ncbi:hypothetical protein IWQ49_000696 [Labrenzia sp. EL_126]|nr:hypothetical protein [Labrenzia sp. EL_126]
MNDIADSIDSDVPALLRNVFSIVEFRKLLGRLLCQAHEAIEDFGMLPVSASHKIRHN